MLHGHYADIMKALCSVMLGYGELSVVLEALHARQTPVFFGFIRMIATTLNVFESGGCHGHALMKRLPWVPIFSMGACRALNS